MGDTLRQSIDTLKIVEHLLGLTRPITLNSCIYQHADYCGEVLNHDDDLYVIDASIENPITLKQIIHVFEQMQKQFKHKETNDRSYYYEGFTFKNNLEINWGS